MTPHPRPKSQPPNFISETAAGVSLELNPALSWKKPSSKQYVRKPPLLATCLSRTLALAPSRTPTSMVVSISLNGPDNVGKTTQLDLFPRYRDISLLRSLHHYDNSLGDMVSDGSIQHWWWEASSDEEFVDKIFRAQKKRLSVARGSAVVIDRGRRMFEAVYIAVIVVKSCALRLDLAKEKFRCLIQALGIQIPFEDISILIKHRSNLEESVAITLARRRR
jgi:hypothetical protein